MRPVLRYCSAALLGLTILGPAAAADAPTTDKVGKKIERVTLANEVGQPLRLDDVSDKKAIVVVFLSFECPVSNSYAQRLGELTTQYADKGVAFFGVCPCEDAAEQIEKHRKEFKLPFPVVRDDKQAVAEAFKAEFTPEAFVLDRFHVLRYRGRIDNAFAARLKKNQQTTEHDLVNALDAVLAGKDVKVPATKPIGCPIQQKVAARAVDNAPTFHKDVLPILQKNCQGCHRPGEVGPFPLMTYKNAASWASDIKDYTQDRRMPPWKPVDGPEFRGERKMAPKDIDTLAAWADAGAPEGDPKDAPAARAFPDKWQLGEPDLVLTPSEEFRLGPDGGDYFRCFVMPTDLPEDRYVTAVEFRPGNPRVVHHAVLLLDPAGRARGLERREQQRADPAAADRGPGYVSPMTLELLPGALTGPWPMVGVWVPGQAARRTPEGTGYLLPKGCDVVLQIHYSRTGRAERDRTSVGLYFAPKPVARPIEGLSVPGLFLAIPAGAERHRVRGRAWVHQDCTLYSVFPHMHLLGKEIKLTMTPPGGERQTLLALADWDFNWQETYAFKKPIRAPAGTRFDLEALYDNSAGNPFNPSRPPRDVLFGLQTTDEMCAVLMEATTDRRGRIIPLPFPPREVAARK